MRRKLNFGFLAIILLLWAICVYAVVSNIEVRKIDLALKDEIVPGAIGMTNIKYEATRIKSMMLSYVIRGNVVREGETIKQKMLQGCSDFRKSVQNHFKEGYDTSLEEREISKKIKDLMKKLISVSIKVVTLKDNGVANDKLFDKIKEEFRPVFINLRDTVNKHAQAHYDRISKAEIEIQNKHNAQVGSVAVLGVAATLLAVFVGFMVDRYLSKYIRQRNLAKEELRRKEERLGLALRGGDLGIWDWDIQTDEVRFNERWVGMKGYSLRELEPRMSAWEKLVHPEDLPGVREKLNDHLEGETSFYEAEFRMRHKSGEWVWILDKGRVIEWDEDDHPIRACGTHLDITERKKAEEKILHMANHDPLTGLPNLRLARDRILLAMGLASRHKTISAVMFMDLDEFKKVNDGFGHETGDALLKEMAARFLSCVREVDTVARVGGDEFLLIASDLSTKDDAAKIARKVIQRVGEPFTYNGNRLNVGVSIGIAMYPEDGKEADTLIRTADKAMYAAKESGKGRFVFSDVVG